MTEPSKEALDAVREDGWDAAIKALREQAAYMLKAPAYTPTQILANLGLRPLTTLKPTSRRKSGHNRRSKLLVDMTNDEAANRMAVLE